MDKDRDKIIENALAQIERAYGKGAIIRLGNEGPLKDIESVPTGSLELDMALGVGGIPRGRVTEIF
jgi:recombination protein RecA